MTLTLLGIKLVSFFMVIGTKLNGLGTKLTSLTYGVYLSVATWITEIIEAMTDGFLTLGTAILTFIKQGFMDLFLIYTESGGTITVSGASYFAIFTFVCLGIALTVKLTQWITSLCRRKI